MYLHVVMLKAPLLGLALFLSRCAEGDGVPNQHRTGFRTFVVQFPVEADVTRLAVRSSIPQISSSHWFIHRLYWTVLFLFAIVVSESSGVLIQSNEEGLCIYIYKLPRAT
ncbi:hypothetical protein F4782DRAFT_517426 [Xylaria castorea]|nr:hypothetical protein F4782DRAFT_517426 [Xylaria castorea]